MVHVISRVFAFVAAALHVTGFQVAHIRRAGAHWTLRLKQVGVFRSGATRERGWGETKNPRRFQLGVSQK